MCLVVFINKRDRAACGGIISAASVNKPPSYLLHKQSSRYEEELTSIIRPGTAAVDMTMTLGRLQCDELLAQLRELLMPSPAATPVNVESAGRPHACDDGRRRRRCRRGSKKRARDDDTITNNGGEQHEEPPCSSAGSKRSRSKKQPKSTSFVTSVPDFDGYRWRKYGQKQIEGAMYARSYYRCTRSAEQGCPAKRTVQRNDDDAAAPAEYTVVLMGQHTCTATDSLEAPVILETTALVVAPDIGTTNNRPDGDDRDDTFTSVAGSCSSTTTTGTGIESPAISDDITTWSSSSGSVVDDYRPGLLDDSCWASSWASLQEMEDFTGPIRSPVHVPADGWTIDPFFPLQLANNNEHVSHYYFSSAA